jgi:hypothetical protein
MVTGHDAALAKKSAKQGWILSPGKQGIWPKGMR